MFARTFRCTFFALDPGREIETQLRDLLPFIRQALDLAANGVGDGFILRIPQTTAGIYELPDVVLHVLRVLGSISAPATNVHRANLYDPAWWFRIDDHPVFVLTLDSRLPMANPRFIPKGLGTYLIFQHRWTFTSRFKEEIPMSTRRAVRRSFASAGMTYTHECGVLPRIPGAPGQGGTG
jgi:hypothetical protein